MRTYTILSILTLCLLNINAQAMPAPIRVENQPAQEIRANMQRWRTAIMTSPRDSLLRQQLAARLASLNNAGVPTGFELIPADDNRN